LFPNRREVGMRGKAEIFVMLKLMFSPLLWDLVLVALRAV